MSTTTQEQKLLIKLVISMFGISPGHAYLPVVEKGFEDLGRGLPDTVSALASLPQFQARYPAGMTGDAFATKFLASMGLAADAPLHRLAADLFNAGTSPQQIIFAAVQALDSPTLPPQYAAARALLENKVEVAYYHSQVLGRTETDFTALAKILENVTQDPATVTAAKLALDQPLVPEAGGGPPPVFAVTKGVGDIASFTTAGTQIDVTEAGGTFTFTSTGTSAGTATLTGPLAGIIAPAGTTVVLSSALANGKAFSGAGTTLVVANAGGEDLTTFTGTGVGAFALTSGQNYTLTAAQAAIGRIGTTGAAGTLTDAGTTTVRDTLAALGGGVAATLKAHGADSVIASTTVGANISGIAVAGIDSIVLVAGNYTLTAAQAALVDGTVGAQTLTLTTQASGMLLPASVETFVLGNFANSVTLGSSTQNLSSPSGSAITLAIGGGAPTGVLALGHASDDMLVATDGANITGVSGGAATTAEKLTLTGGITMTRAQHEALTSIAAPGSADSVTITNSGTVTTRADVETYKVANSGSANTVLIGQGATNVTGGSGNATLVISTGLAVTGTYGLAGGADVISAATGVDLSGVNGGAATTAESLDLNGAVKMTQAQHGAFTSFTATGGSDSVEITTGGAVTAKAGIETYTISGGGSNTLTVLAGATQIIGAAGKATTVDVGGNTVSGTWSLGNANDVIVASGASIAGVNSGLATTAENLTLTGGIIMTQAQSVGLTNISATGGADFITITTGGTVTARAGVETYTVSGGASNNVFVLASTNVNGAAGNATTVNVGGTTVTGNYQLGHGADLLEATNGANISGATTSSVENLTVSGDISMRANQYTAFSTITATGNNDRIILISALNGAQVLNAAVENFTLAAGNNSVILGAAQSINAQALTAGQSLTLDSGFAATITLADGNLAAGSATGKLTVTGGTTANTITLGSGSDTVNAGDGADIITGGAGIDTLNGEDGNDTFLYGSMAEFLSANALLDLVNGGNGIDTAEIGPAAIVLTTSSDLTRMTSVEQIKARSQSATNFAHSIVVNSDFNLGGVTTIDLSGDTKFGSSANFDMTGVTRDLTLKGVGAGVNNFVGGAGADTIVGGSGADFIFYANAASFISGTAVVDSIDGGGGTDAITVGGSFSVGSTQSLARITNVEALRSEVNAGAARNFALTVQSDANLGSISQIDLVYDQVTGSTATINLSGVTRAMTVSGVFQGTNAITGGSGGDTLSGGRVNDTFRGGGGNDTITTSITGTATYVFEATGSANGSDTLTGVRSGGAFDFRAFLGAAGSMSGSVVDSTSNAAGLDLSAGNNIGVRYGSSSLSSTDILLATDVNVAGEVAVADNGKVVVFSFSSASTANSANGSIYYVQDADPGVGQIWSVTLVGTMSGSSATIAQIVSSGVFL